MQTDPIEIFAGTILEAGLVQSLLENAAIESWLRDEIMGTLNPWWVVPGGAGAVKVLVSKKDQADAKKVIDAYELHHREALSEN